MAGSDASEGQAVWQPGGAEEDSRLREGNRHLHLAYDEEEEELHHTKYVPVSRWYDSTKKSREQSPCLPPPLWARGKASASRAEDPRFESRLRPDFFGVESYQ